MQNRANLDAEFEGNGMFRAGSGKEIFGTLRVAGSNSQLSMWHGEAFDFRAPTSGVITGTLHDLTKVTLIDCINIGSASGGTPDGEYHSADFFPHFVLKGKLPFEPVRDKIDSVTIFVEDAHVLFYDFAAFGSVSVDKELFKEVLKKRRVKNRTRVGKYPHLMYFTGTHDIISFDSVLGRITASHFPTANSGGPSGIGMENRVGIRIKPHEPVPFEEVPNRILDLLRLLATLIGRPQKLEETWLTVRRGRSAEAAENRQRMYWSHTHVWSGGRSHPHPGDVLLSPIRFPAQFKRVCARWLEMDMERKDARVRFLDSFAEGNHYGVNRIVGAANMFDILPASAAPKSTPLSSELKVAKDEAKRIFGSLPATDEREALMAALSRLGTATLRRKMLHRADLILAHVGSRFPNLDIVLREAVRCRNHYVHGSPTKIDYSNNVNALAFLVATLEFVFAASDLVEAGWDIKTWCAEPQGGGHPFGEYKSDYMLGLAELQKLLK